MTSIEFYLPGEKDGLPRREWSAVPRVEELVSLYIDGSCREFKVTCVHWFDGVRSGDGPFSRGEYFPVAAVTLGEVSP